MNQLGKYRTDILLARALGYARRRYYAWHRLRPPSWPFLSGDSFRSLAQHVWDEAEEPSFSIDEVRENDIVFVSWYITKFLAEYAPKIPVPFYMISSNSDQAISYDDIERLRKTRCRHWWAANLTVQAEGVTPIPLGLENERLCWFGDVRDFIKVRKISRRTIKQERICWGFAVGNNPEVRGPLRDALRSNPLSVELSRMNPYTYRREIIKYKYIASPPGNGPDCHRTWEAIALGVTPVLLKSTLALQFKRQKHPVVVLDTIEDFATFPK
jgi:hypothetical protein